VCRLADDFSEHGVDYLQASRLGGDFTFNKDGFLDGFLQPCGHRDVVLVWKSCHIGVGAPVPHVAQSEASSLIAFPTPSGGNASHHEWHHAEIALFPVVAVKEERRRCSVLDGRRASIIAIKVCGNSTDRTQTRQADTQSPSFFCKQVHPPQSHRDR
jgi:hypothetical protein